MTTANVSTHERELNRGERFRFGENWSRFLNQLSADRIAAAECSLTTMLRMHELTGKRFLDVGSGSGLFSLAARRLGAQVHSFDFDPKSVACTAELRQRYYPNDPNWFVQEMSVLDKGQLTQLGQFDIVYSWGVLHHTGQMWAAIGNTQQLVAPGGLLFIAIYNDLGSSSRRWLLVKRTYNRLPRILQPAFAALAVLPNELKRLARAFIDHGLTGLRTYLNSWQEVESLRGMDHWHDIVDWVGGYPYEYATPDEIFEYHRSCGFSLVSLRCGNIGTGCNEFVFQRTNSSCQ